MITIIQCLTNKLLCHRIVYCRQLCICVLSNDSLFQFLIPDLKMTKLNEKEVLARSHATCLGNVRKLICWGSNLTDISIVQKMVNLEVLNVSVNNLSTLKDLSHCPRLKEIYIRKNHVKNIDQIAFLKNLPQLTVLWLSDNPISSFPKYREIVLRNLPGLVKLDSVEVTNEEKILSEEHGCLVESEELLPNYQGLDLNHTLTMDAVLLHTKNNPHNRMKETNEKLPTAVNINDANQRRLELGLKQLDLRSSSVLHDSDEMKCNDGGTSSTVNRSDDAKCNGLLSVNKALKEETKNSSCNITNRHSNTVNAIKLLLNDLESAELHEVNVYTQSLLKTYNENLYSRSANLLED